MDADNELLNFLRERGVSEDDILKMVENKIDKYVIRVMSHTQLESYLPLEGDRIAVKKFCNTSTTESTQSKRKASLFHSLRRKLFMKERNESLNSDEDVPVKKSHLSGNKNARKTTRKIELGWLHFDPVLNIFKQVRKKNGGGTRKIDIDKDANLYTIQSLAIAFFFKDGYSKLGPIENFHTEIRDYSEEILSDHETVGDMYRKTGMNMLRFFLTTTAKPHVETTKPVSIDNIVPASNTIITPESDPSFSGTSSQTELITASTPEKNQMSLFDATSSYVPSSLLSTDLSNTNLSPVELNGSVVGNNQMDIEQLGYPTFDSSETEIFFNMNNRNISGHSNFNETTLPYYEDTTTVELTIHRGAIAFKEMIGYFKDPTIINKHLIINRILPNGEKEQGEDTGGILRDLLSEFWTDFYEKCTVGRLLKVPSLRHDFGSIEWKSAANILLYGYRFTGYWPILLAKTFMLHCINQNYVIQNPDLISDFYNYVSIPDKEVFQKAENDFASVDTEDLMDILDTHDCRTTPRAENIKSIILEIAHKELIQTSMFVCDCWKEILGCINEKQCNELYEKLQPTNKKVVQLLSFPEGMDSQSLEVSKHLKTYVRNLDNNKLSLFLRFCTGSDLLTINKISVEFTVMTGLLRRPIAHTCGCMLQLSKVYESYMEFRSEFDNVLNGGVWVMDII